MKHTSAAELFKEACEYLNAHDTDNFLVTVYAGVDVRQCDENGVPLIFTLAHQLNIKALQVVLERKPVLARFTHNKSNLLHVLSRIWDEVDEAVLGDNVCDENEDENENADASASEQESEDNRWPERLAVLNLIQKYAAAGKRGAEKWAVMLNQENDNAQCPIDLAIAEHCREYTKWLLQQGSSPNTENALGQSTLWLSAQDNDINLAKILLAYDADPFIFDCDGLSVLDAALARNNIEYINEFIKVLEKTRDAENKKIKKERIKGITPFGFDVLKAPLEKQPMALDKILQSDRGVFEIDQRGNSLFNFLTNLLAHTEVPSDIMTCLKRHKIDFNLYGAVDTDFMPVIHRVHFEGKANHVAAMVHAGADLFSESIKIEHNKKRSNESEPILPSDPPREDYWVLQTSTLFQQAEIYQDDEDGKKCYEFLNAYRHQQLTTMCAELNDVRVKPKKGHDPKRYSLNQAKSFNHPYEKGKEADFYPALDEQNIFSENDHTFGKAGIIHRRIFIDDMVKLRLVQNSRIYSQ